MSDQNAGQPWGMCGAFGCPLTGSLGRGDMWACFCHADANAGAFHDITKAIRNRMFLAEATIDIRRHFGTEEWASVYRQIQRRFIEAGRRDLLLGAADCSPHREGKPIVKMWLARLEREILTAVQSVGKRRTQPATVQTAALAGPSHVTGFIENQPGESHGA